MTKSRDYKEYNDLGVRFIYPTNWTVQTETWDKGTYGISVDSPEGSFWSIAIFPLEVDLDEAAKSILSGLHAEYDEIEESEVERVVADCLLDGYEVNFFYLDLSSTAQALKFEDGERGYVVFWQTCDRLNISGESLSRVDVFDVMTHTLVCNLTGQEVDFWEGDDEEEDFRSEKEAKAEEEREFYRRKYENARREIQNDYWRNGGVMTDSNAGLDDFVEARRGSGSRHGRDEYSDVARSVALSDERLEDFLRDDEDDDDEFRENLVNDGFEHAGEEDYDEDDRDADEGYDDGYDRDDAFDEDDE